MNFIYLICFLFTFKYVTLIDAFEVPEHVKKQTRKLQAICEKETGITKDHLLKSGTTELSNERAVQCFLHCMFDKVGLIDSDNIMHLEYLLDVLPVELHALIEKLFKSCGTQAGADGCETVFLTVQCYIKTEPKVFENSLKFLGN